MLTTILAFLSSNLAKVLNTKAGIIAAVCLTFLLGMYIKGCSDGKASRDGEVAGLKEDITQRDAQIYSLKHAPVKRDTVIRVIQAVPQKPIRIIETHRDTLVRVDTAWIEATRTTIQGLVDLRLINGGMNGDTLVPVDYQATITARDLIDADFELFPFEIPAKTITNTGIYVEDSRWYDYIPGLGWLIRVIKGLGGF